MSDTELLVCLDFIFVIVGLAFIALGIVGDPRQRAEREARRIARQYREDCERDRKARLARVLRGSVR
jgi:hypothetical protein